MRYRRPYFFAWFVGAWVVLMIVSESVAFAILLISVGVGIVWALLSLTKPRA